MLELRDHNLARRYLLEGLWLTRLAPVAAELVRPALEWALELSADGQPLPPLGFVLDVGQLVFAAEPKVRTDLQAGIGFPAGLAREYEDLVLGKLLADTQFERAADALRHYQGRDRARGLAFLINQLRERAGFAGALLSPGVIRGLLEASPEAVLTQGWDSLGGEGLLPLLAELYQSLVAAARRSGEVLAVEDVFELEHGTALLQLGQRLALRQVLQAAIRLEAELPAQRPRPVAARRDVPTHIFDEDIYPVGGYASVSTRGAIESLLPSQLAYMEEDEPLDLFDVKYLRDELLFYSRDENQFRRRRRSFIIALLPDLAQARHKDPELPWQKIVLALGLLAAAVRRLTDWLSSDALLFDFCFIGPERPAILAQERQLLELLFHHAIANGTVRITAWPDAASLAESCVRVGKRSLCHALWVSAAPLALGRLEHVSQAGLRIDGAPSLETDTGAWVGQAGLAGWAEALGRLLASWA